MRRFSLTIALIFPLFLAACDSSEDRAEEYYQSALALIEEGDHERAIVELRNVFQLNGSHFEARHKLAELYLEHRESPQDAYSQYLRLAEQYPDDLKSRIALSQIAFSASNWEEVERHGAKAEELAPEDPVVQVVTLARAYRAAALDDDEPAREGVRIQAEALLETQPDQIILRNIVIDDHLRNQRFSDALVELDWLLERDPKNETYLDQKLQVLLQMGDEGAVEDQLRAMIDLFPEDAEKKATLVRYFLSRENTDAAEDYIRSLSEAAGPDDAGPTVDLIRFLLQVRGVDAARVEIEAAIAAKTDPTPFRVLGAGLDFAGGQQEAALATMEDIIVSNPEAENINDIKVGAAQMFLQTGNEVRARALVEDVLSDDATMPEALKMQSAWLIDADDTDGAITALRSALDRNPDDAQTMTLMANAYARSGSTDLARDFLSRAVEASGNAPEESIRYAQILISEERYLPAEDVLLPSLRLNPDNEEILTTLGRLYLGMEDNARAEQVIATLRRIGSETAKQSAIQLETIRLNQQGGATDAIAYLEEIAGAANADLGAQFMLMRARLASGDTDGALALAERLVADNPDDLTTKAALAAAKSVAGDLEGSVETYREILVESPANPTIVLEVVRLQNRLGNQDAAREEVDAALAVNPQDARLLWAKATFYERDGDIDEAITVYEELYARDSQSYIIANNLASMLSTYRTDEESLERAWAIARRFKGAEIPALMDTYGWILHRRGDFEEAVDVLEGAALGLPNDPIVQYHFAEALASVERTEDALAQFRRVIEVAAEVDTRPQIAAARARITELEALPQSE